MSGFQVAARAVIFGRVQGVGFRYGCMREAAHAGARVSGWIRNTSAGAVEIFVQGEKDAVNALIEWCRKGPPRAKVERMDVTRAEIDPAITEFEIR